MVGQATLADTMRRTGGRSAVAGRAGRLVLVVDQFEEVFTLNQGRGGASQEAFIAALCAAATQPACPGAEPAALVVIAVRGDFWARCAAHARLAPMMQDGLFVVGPMTRPELQEAITGPAATAGLQVDADLTDAILADLRTAGRDEAEGTLPLLSQAMMLTWGKREGNRLTARGYNETGGVARCVEFSAEAVYAALPDAGQHVAREIFQALVLVDPDGQLARRPVPRAELCASRRGTARHPVDTVLEAFAASRLLVLDGDTVQIAHDVLLRAWPRLRGWLDREQASWILYTQLQEDATRWAEHGRDASFLYRGAQLAAVQQAATRWAIEPARYPALTQDQSGFLTAGQRAATRSTRRRQLLAAALVVLLIVSVSGAVLAGLADKTATRQRNLATQQRDLALASQLAAQSEALDATEPGHRRQARGSCRAFRPDPPGQGQPAGTSSRSQNALTFPSAMALRSPSARTGNSWPSPQVKASRYGTSPPSTRSPGPCPPEPISARSPSAQMVRSSHQPTITGPRRCGTPPPAARSAHPCGRATGPTGRSRARSHSPPAARSLPPRTL